MKILNKSVVILFLITLISCGNKQNTFNGEFEKSVTLPVETISEIFTWCPTSLTYLNGYLVVVNNCKDSVLQIVDTKSMETHWGGVKGQGPNEFIGLNWNGQKVIKDGKQYLRMFDTQKRNCVLVNPKEIYNNEASPIIESKLPKNLFLWEDLLKTEEDKWVYSNLQDFNDSFLTFADTSGLPVTTTEFLPEANVEYSKKVISYVYYSKTRYNEKKEMFVSALRNFPYIALFDKKGHRVNELIIGDYKVPAYKNEELNPVNNTNVNYNEVITSEKYIYVVNFNVNYDKYIESEMNISPSIEVYDWELKPQCEINFDVLFCNMDIDFENKVIYGFSTKDFDHLVSKVVIPKELYKFF